MSRAAASWAGACAVLAASGLHPDGAVAAGAPLKTIAVLDFELTDHGPDQASDAAQQARLQAISRALRREFSERRLYAVLDLGPADAMIADLRSRRSLHDCNGCDADIGKALGAERTLTGWVQKVSNLILGIHIQIRDVQSGRIVQARSVSIRGNTDDSWLRGIRYLARGMEEAQQGNR